MTPEQYVHLLAEVMANHSWAPLRGHMIKYVRGHFDTRTGKFYGVTLFTIKGKKDFYVVNENRHRDLYQWLSEFLSSDP